MYPTVDTFPKEMMPSIERFLRDVHPGLTPGLDSYAEVFASAFFPLQRRRELEVMMRIARAVSTNPCDCTHATIAADKLKSGCERCNFTKILGGPKVVMEIGADKGGGVYHWCQCLSLVNTVIASEIRGTPYSALFDRAFPQIKFEWLQDSRDPTSFRVVKALDKPIDVLFIDGDKSYFDKDFDAYLPLMNPKGVVFFHDVADEPMRGAFMRSGDRRRTEIIRDVTESEAAVERQVGGFPPTCDHENWLRYWRGRSCQVGVVWLGGQP